MKKTTKISIPLGELIAALYSEAAELTDDEKVKAAIVFLALHDLLHRNRELKSSRAAA